MAAMAGEILLVIVGLALLITGGDLLTRGASNLASICGVRPIIIGLTVVAFGTSMPEALTSFVAAMKSKPDIVIGNVVGSNIFNIALVLGIASIIRPLKVEAGSLKREVPFVMGSAALIWLLAKDGILERLDGVILLVVFSLFLGVCFVQATEVEEKNRATVRGGKIHQASLVALGLALLITGAKCLVEGSVGVARAAGLSELFIGLTIVAVGTSLPELATSLVASVRREDDLAVGNVTGSNIFNILFILGVSAICFPLDVSPNMISRDMPIMIGLSLALLPILKSGFRVSRVEGIVLVSCYLGYAATLINTAGLP